ncbi:hypothetical protein K438DRAFT_1786978 [Mycena galopus ATCC 62051]|nr:hypothetical protein K438DRAFT_1786978 [Mycena galopus ATCC 62051]
MVVELPFNFARGSSRQDISGIWISLPQHLRIMTALNPNLTSSERGIPQQVRWPPQAQWLALERRLVSVTIGDDNRRPSRCAGHASQSLFLAGAKPAKWLAKPTKWLASHFAGRGRVIPPKLTPPPDTSQLARAQAILASQKRHSPPQCKDFMVNAYITQNMRGLCDILNGFDSGEDRTAKVISAPLLGENGRLVSSLAQKTRCLLVNESRNLELKIVDK